MSTLMGDLILLFAPPYSFMTFAFVMIAECLIAKSIMEDIAALKINPAATLSALKSKIFVKEEIVISQDRMVLDLISAHQNLGIVDIARHLKTSVWAARKLVQKLVIEGYAVRQRGINLHGRSALCYRATGLHKRQIGQYVKAASGVLQSLKIIN
jgi:hypothetical protein